MSIILYNVLWIDDDQRLVDDYIDEAYDYSLNLVHFSCWTDAKRELLTNIGKYEAIILDAKCRVDNDLSRFPKAISFLSRVLSDLNSLMKERQTFLPWYILSAGEAEQIGGIDDVVDGFPREWDADRSSSYYHKEGRERKLLFTRIRDFCEKNPSVRLKLKTIVFPQVFAAIRTAFQTSTVEEYMEELLMPFATTDMSATDCNRNFHLLRKVLEAIYLHMDKNGDFPESVRSAKNVNLNWCSLILQGEEEDILEQPRLKDKLAEFKSCRAYGTMPKILSQCVKTILQTANQFDHVDDPDELPPTYHRRYSLKEMTAQTGETPYLIRSFALQLCDILLWYEGRRTCGT